MSWNSMVSQKMTPEQRAQIIAQVCDQMERQPLAVKRERRRLDAEVKPAVAAALSRMSLSIDPVLQASIAQDVVARVGGLGFLNDLLPSEGYDPGLSEIAVNPDGKVWVLRKSAQYMEPLPDARPSVEEVWRTVESLLAPLGRSISETAPSVDSKLPREPGAGGARIKVLHPSLCPGAGYPSINVRLFEEKPVLPDRLVEWGLAPAPVIQSLLEHVRRRLRLLVLGGTKTGKTTTLSALCNGIPRQVRIVKIEDPEEIWVEHANVVTIEARPPQIGSNIIPYSLRDGVRDAMRMSPDWLIVGEVRDGPAALELMNALMSDHPGLSTFHADSPEDAVWRMALQIFQFSQMKFADVKGTFATSIDIVAQISFVEGVRRIIGIWEVNGMRGGDVNFNRLYTLGDETMAESTRRR